MKQLHVLAVWVILGVCLIVVTEARIVKYKAVTVSSPIARNCDIDNLDVRKEAIVSCDGQVPNDITVAHTGFCDVRLLDSNKLLTTRVTCIYGTWNWPIRENQATDHNRFKREPITVAAGIGIAAGVVGIASGLYSIGCNGGWWKCSEPVIIVKTPPSFSSNCPPGDLQPLYYADEGTTETTVTWAEPSASDSDGSITSQGQIFGTKKGESFTGTASGNPHSIVYIATDNDGQSAYCFFSFTVKVKTCTTLSWPQNGFRQCPNDNILGSTCTYQCNEGYQLDGSGDVTCQNSANPTWTTIPTCEKISCGAPPSVTNGEATCTDPDHVYNSYCSYTCDANYELEGQVLTVCKADRNWLRAVDTNCIDDEPPTIDCKSPQKFYADYASTSTSVTWEEPVINDLIDPNPSLVKVSGPDAGVVLETGTSDYVTYQAIDAEGNQSPQCTVELRVLDIPCGHPLDTLEDGDLRFNCTMGTYSYGDQCTLDCALNLPLEGTDLITCEANTTENGDMIGYWDWGNGTMPSCRDISCADIDPPINGAMVYDTVAARPIATMLCNNQFDIPLVDSAFNGIFLCQDSGIWSPNYTKAPGCIETASSRGFILESEFYYYGTCGVDDNIEEQFEAIVGKLDQIFVALCPSDTSCSVQNPRIVCGPISQRRKRSVSEKNKRSVDSYKTKSGKVMEQTGHHALRHKRQSGGGDVMVFTFGIQTEFDFTGYSLNQLYDKVDEIQLTTLKPAIQMELENGTFDIDSWVLNDDSFQTDEYGRVYCDAGNVLDGHIYCKPCPPGYPEINGKCEACPIGEYSDTAGSVNCTKCPDGFSTRQTASESLDNCTKLCDPGHYSPDTFAPCAPCKLGYFQSQPGQATCSPCPDMKNTTVNGRTSETDCQHSDIKLNKKTNLASIATIGVINNLSVMFWSKVSGSGAPRATIKVDDAVEISIRDTISVTTNPSEASAIDTTVGGSSTTAWIHTAVTWDTTNNLLSVYYRGTLVVDQMSVTPASSPLIQNGQLSIVADGDADILIAGFRIMDTIIDQTDVTATTTSSCHNSDSSDVVNMGHLASTNTQGISVVTPSKCDHQDECQDNPCGNHTCTNEIDGFTCTCSNGWSGVTCTIPPDRCINNECENGATCINKQTEYECQCPPGYRGFFCDIPPVDGVWSAWSVWTDCSVTCNGGTRTRDRTCDSPPPDPLGQDCVGDDMQIEPCNTDACPECPSLSRGYKNLKTCDASLTGTETCTFTCLPGYSFANGLDVDIVQTYRCGLETDYTWEPHENVPNCSPSDRPVYYREEASVRYNQAIPEGDEPAVVEAVRQNLDAETYCDSAANCVVDVTVNGNTRKRSVGSVVTITIQITLTDQSDLKLDDFEVNGTVTSGIQEILDALVLLENITQLLNTSTATVFDVAVNGLTYNVDPSTITFDGSLSCGAGQVITNGLCTDCPVGTYKNGDFCAYCDRGTYQDLTGQTSCTSCPSYYTTITIGSTSAQQCSVHDTSLTTTTGQNLVTTGTTQTAGQNLVTTGTTKPTGTNEEDNDDNDNLGTIIIITSSIGAVLIFCILAIVSLMLVKKWCVSCRVSAENEDNEDKYNTIHVLPHIRREPANTTFRDTLKRSETPTSFYYGGLELDSNGKYQHPCKGYAASLYD